MTLVNGRKTQSVDVSDRGFQYGDGIFETIGVVEGMPLFLEEHLDRLERGCERLIIPLQDKSLLLREVDAVIPEGNDGVVKIIVSRGCVGRGYQPSRDAIPTRVVSFHSGPAYPQSFQCEGVSVLLCDTRLGLNNSIAGLKHLNRLEQVLASMEWNERDFQEGLMMDQEGYIVEGSKTNIFAVNRGVLHTPRIDRCGVLGIMRSVVIEVALANGIEVHQTRLTLDELVNADELFLTNSVIGIWPVKQFQSTRYRVGPIALKLQSLLALRIETEVRKCITGG